MMMIIIDNKWISDDNIYTYTQNIFFKFVNKTKINGVNFSFSTIQFHI